MTPAINPTDLESTNPEEAVDRYLREKRGEGVTENTRAKLRYSLRPFLEWTEEVGINDLTDLTPKDMHDFKLWLQERKDGGYAASTLEAYLYDVRALIESAESYGGAPAGLADTIRIPDARGSDSRKHVVLDEGRAEDIQTWLERYEFATRRHVEFAIINDCGLRVGALRSLDLDDVIREESATHLRLVNREQTNTRLKNGDKSERRVFLRPETAKLIDAWIDDQRPEVQDSYGREPLITTVHGRVSGDCIKTDMKLVTAPCYIGDSCENCNGDDHNRKCPQALSPHPIRRGAITRDLTDGTIPDHVSERYDVTVDVIQRHYDARTDREKMEVRREAYMNAMHEAGDSD